MILTGPAIAAAVRRGDIDIEPFDSGNINPNSYNYGLGKELMEVASADPYRLHAKETIGEEGRVLIPGRVYLAATSEILGSRRYVTTLLGRSSVGRLGLFLNISADLGHAGCRSRWTLELTVVQPLRVYPGMPVGQVAFWQQEGDASRYSGRYQGDAGPKGSKDPILRGARR